MEESSLFDESSQYSLTSQTSLVNQLWDVCETSQARVKLILPDIISEPFYLPKNIKYGSNKLNEKEIERENRRVEFVCARDLNRRHNKRGNTSAMFPKYKL